MEINARKNSYKVIKLLPPPYGLDNLITPVVKNLNFKIMGMFIYKVKLALLLQKYHLVIFTTG